MLFYIMSEINYIYLDFDEFKIESRNPNKIIDPTLKKMSKNELINKIESLKQEILKIGHELSNLKQKYNLN